MASMQELDPAELEAMMEAVAAFNTALEEADVLRFAGGLHPPSTAKTAVRWASMAAKALGSRIEVRALQEAPGE